jgi:hypothetical protein
MVNENKMIEYNQEIFDEESYVDRYVYSERPNNNITGQKGTYSLWILEFNSITELWEWKNTVDSYV